jgi:hypothetical protein
VTRLFDLGLSVSTNELRVIQSVGIIVGLLVSTGAIWIGIYTARAANRAVRVTTLLSITASHRDIWRQYAMRPQLARVLDWEAKPDQMTEDEQQWLRELILHLAASFEAGRYGALPVQEGLDADVRQLMSKPMPRAVWRQLRPYQNSAFASYIDRQIANAERRHQGTPFGIPHGGRNPADFPRDR